MKKFTAVVLAILTIPVFITGWAFGWVAFAFQAGIEAANYHADIHTD